MPSASLSGLPAHEIAAELAAQNEVATRWLSCQRWFCQIARNLGRRKEVGHDRLLKNMEIKARITISKQPLQETAG